MTEKQKMLAGELYNGMDKELVNDRLLARMLFQKINNTSEDKKAERDALFYELFEKAGENLYIEPPFFCDYGYNISCGNNVFLNFNCCILDVMAVTIGDEVLIGPGVQIYTATHPMDAQTRSSGLEYAKPVAIGNKVWIGGAAIICPGVTIGDNVVIGAGAVVTGDVPNNVFVGGNPARIIKQLE